MKPSKTEHRGLAALRLQSAQLELVVTTGVGPRVASLRHRRGGVDNLFLEIAPEEEKLGDFILRGGHRLWHSPEDRVRTYQPDNDPLTVKVLAQGVSLTAPVEPKTGLQKTIKVELTGAATVRVTHSLANHNLWAVGCAPWALTMLRAGGFGVLPLPARGTHAGNLLPTYALVPWTYTDLSLPVWRLHRDFVGIDVAEGRSAQKLGITDYPGWSAYWYDGSVFVKHARRVAGAVYPDFGSCFETFTNGRMIELETLGPLAPIAPGGRVTHVEHWTVLADQPRPDTAETFAKLAVRVQAWLKSLR